MSKHEPEHNTHNTDHEPQEPGHESDHQPGGVSTGSRASDRPAASGSPIGLPVDARAARPRSGRGTGLNPANRFDTTRVEAVDDGWWREETPDKTATETIVDNGPRIISTNRSPDLPFDQSINPYRGCEHGCIYCYARPTHAYWDLSPGLDFETRIIIKPDAAVRLRATLDKPGYECKVINIGANTDPYQPLERSLRTTRSILEVLREYRHPFGIITKSALILRDLDILEEMASMQLCSVAISVTTLDNELKRRMEPRTANGSTRIRVIETLASRGIPVTVMFAPVIPALNDAELETILDAARRAGATAAGYIFVRLPWEVKTLFRDWLAEHYPDRAKHVMSVIRQSRGGADYKPGFGARMRGEGVFARLFETRYQLQLRRLGYTRPRGAGFALDTTRFRGRQLELF